MGAPRYEADDVDRLAEERWMDVLAVKHLSGKSRPRVTSLRPTEVRPLPKRGDSMATNLP
jgi:hypothetical protein